MKVTVERPGFLSPPFGNPAKHVIIFEQVIDEFTNNWDAQIILWNKTYSLRKVSEYVEILK